MRGESVADAYARADYIVMCEVFARRGVLGNGWCTFNSATNNAHASRTRLVPVFRIASLRASFSFVSSSQMTVISRSSNVSSLRSGIVILPFASTLTLPFRHAQPQVGAGGRDSDCQSAGDWTCEGLA